MKRILVDLQFTSIQISSTKTKALYLFNQRSWQIRIQKALPQSISLSQIKVFSSITLKTLKKKKTLITKDHLGKQIIKQNYVSSFVLLFCAALFFCK